LNSNIPETNQQHLTAIMQRAEMKSGVLGVIVDASAARGARFRHRHWMAAGSNWTTFAG
jgi:hypothetical protein